MFVSWKHWATTVASLLVIGSVGCAGGPKGGPFEGLAVPVPIARTSSVAQYPGAGSKPIACRTVFLHDP